MKIQWVDTARQCTLAARLVEHDDPVDTRCITEEDMIEVANWCNENNCGKRISFDMVKFKNKKEMAMFLLRWS